jgi:hypothetical protein
MSGVSAHFWFNERIKARRKFEGLQTCVHLISDCLCVLLNLKELCVIIYYSSLGDVYMTVMCIDA